MATRDLAALLPLAESIADGTPVDWDAVEARASHDEQAVIRQLRILANLAVLHRSLSADPAAQHDPGSLAITHRGTTAPAIGSWAHLALVERLGGGTFGEVYRAWDRHLEREVALKLLRADESVDDLQASRIATEGRLLARVHHQNVITVHGVAVHDQRVGLWMELVRGATLEQVLKRRGPFSAREAALVGIDLCRALAAIHAAGLVHRDVKAQNVMREEGGRIVLMDLGTGREIDPSRRHALPDLAGTPLYLAPEIFDGANASERTDLYSLGVLLYHLVTGAFPTRATTIDELRDGHAKGTGVRLRDVRADLPTAFVTVVDRAIAHDPGRRYASAGALEADLVSALDDTAALTAPAATPAPAPAADVSRARPFEWRRHTVAAALIAATLVLAAIGWPVFHALYPPAIRIAVLPLINMSQDPSGEYFGDAMTDELIGTLGRLGALNVISRTSVMRFKGSKQPLPEIAKALRADWVLESSFMFVPGNSADGSGAKRVRINARLIKAGTDTYAWDESFEEVVSDLLALQGRVARKVAEGIDLRLTSQQQGSLARTNPENAQAQEAYFQGRYLLFNNLSKDNFIKARQHLERAVQIDPGYARAYAGLARCYSFLDIYGVLSRREAASLTATAAATAVRLDGSLPEAHNQLAGAAFVYQWDWAAAERAYRRAIELNPSYSFARSEYARFLMAQGRLDEALAQARLAADEDPLSAEARGVVGVAFYYQRKYDDAIAERLEASRLDPSSAEQHLGLGRAYAGKGDFERAIAELRQAVTVSGNAPFIMAELARTYAVAGRRSEAAALLASLTDTPSGDGPHLAAQYQTYVYAALGYRDLAFRWLDKAVEEREPNLLWAKVDPRFDPLRQDPRFTTFLARLVPKP